MRWLFLGVALVAKCVFGTYVHTLAQGNAIPVDFFVFMGNDGKAENVAPRTSMNINPPDNVTGFPALCKDRCPMFDESCGTSCIAPQMRWCRCVAELLVQDLSSDFGTLLDADSAPLFTLGEYIEVSKGQDYYEVHDGHTTLYSLMEADSSHAYARRSGRIAVWVSQHVGSADDPDSIIAGTTLLDQPLWKGGGGAGVLLHAQSDRSSKVLSHEVGHVVGFHHTAGPSMLYTYDHPECPKESRHVETHPLVFPSCEVNIMGYWYDGPYCCPGESPSFLLQLRGHQSRKQKCLANSMTHYQEGNCCGSECTHSCPSKELPLPKFDTKAQEHGVALGKMLQCWLHLRTVAEAKPASNLIGMINMTHSRPQKRSVACADYTDRATHARKLGSCTPDVKFMEW